MKKEKVKTNKNILLIAGIAASIIMIVIVLAFLNGSINGSIITGYAAKETGQEHIFNETIIIKELSGNGNAYLCINSEGKIFRSEIPCK